jgi:hypothetical protein
VQDSEDKKGLFFFVFLPVQAKATVKGFEAKLATIINTVDVQDVEYQAYSNPSADVSGLFALGRRKDKS